MNAATLAPALMGDANSPGSFTLPALREGQGQGGSCVGEGCLLRMEGAVWPGDSGLASTQGGGGKGRGNGFGGYCLRDPAGFPRDISHEVGVLQLLVLCPLNQPG